jgi:UPF0716 protein FxsA
MVRDVGLRSLRAMALLVLLFLVLPIAELYVIIQVGQAIGLLPTLAILILDGFVGAALARSQGRAAWEHFNRALSAGRVPARETFDGAMIILGGALLLAPGFITDAIGFLLLVPPTRAMLRGAITRLASRRLGFGWRVSAPRGAGAPPSDDHLGNGRRTDGSYDFEGTAREVTDPTPELPEREA